MYEYIWRHYFASDKRDHKSMMARSDFQEDKQENSKLLSSAERLAATNIRIHYVSILIYV